MKTPVLSLLVAFVILPLLSTAEETREVSELNLLMSNYRRKIEVSVDAEYNAAVNDLKSKYLAALKRAAGDAQKDGQLDRVLAFNEEIERIEKDPEAKAADSSNAPSQLTSLRAVYDRSMKGFADKRQIRQAPTDQRLMVELAELQQSLTVAGRLEDAVVVKEAREKRLGEESAGMTDGDRKQPDEKEELLAWLQKHELYWDATNASELVLQFDGEEVTALADGREVLNQPIKLFSGLEFSFTWNGETNHIVFERNRKQFLRKKPSGSHEGKVRRR